MKTGAVIELVVTKPPDIETDPVNWCLSSWVLPNIVEPLLYDCVTFITDDDTINSLATNLPLTVRF